MVHADMHPATKLRVDAGAMVGRALVAYGQAWADRERGRVTDAHVADMRKIVNGTLDGLVTAAQKEGAVTLGAVPVDDPRDQPVTVTLPVRCWDALGFLVPSEAGRGGRDELPRESELRRYAATYGTGNESLARETIARATRDGLEERFALAKAEADARRPDVLGTLDEFEARAREMLAWWTDAETRRAEPSHFGRVWPLMGNDVRSWMTRDVPHFGFELPKFSFGRTYPYLRFTEEEAAAVRGRVDRVVRVVQTWNETSSCLSLRFDPEDVR